MMAVSASHMLNDVMQSLAKPALSIRSSARKWRLSFFQTGIITFVFQATASLLQPFIGLVTDRRPMNGAIAGGHGVYPHRPRIGLRLLGHLSAAACLGRGDWGYR